MKAPSVFAKPHSAGAIQNRKSPLDPPLSKGGKIEFPLIPAFSLQGRRGRKPLSRAMRGLSPEVERQLSGREPRGECLRRDARTCVCGVQPREEKDAPGCNPSARKGGHLRPYWEEESAESSNPLNQRF